MSIVVRLSPTSLTRENYDEVQRRLESAGVWPILADVGIGFSADPEIFEVHNIAKR